MGENTKVAKADRRWVREVVKRDVQVETDPLASSRRSKREAVDLQIASGPIGGTFLIRNSDKEAIHARLREILASTSPAFIETALHRLIHACNITSVSCVPTETSLNSALALIESLEPAREIEAAIAVDIACLHAASSNMFARLSGRTLNESIRTATNAIGKLQQAMHSAVKTYDLLKRGRRQDIHVHHLHMPGSRAVIGNVQTG